jgi:hypothetical protein
VQQRIGGFSFVEKRLLIPVQKAIVARFGECVLQIPFQKRMLLCGFIVGRHPRMPPFFSVFGLFALESLFDFG